MSDKKTHGSWRGKGYYIALILCAAAIGISGYVYYNDAGDTAALQDVGTPVVATDGVQTQPTSAATVPSVGATEATKATEATQPKSGKLATCAPVEGSTVADYAMEVLSYNETTRDWRVHNGVDIAAEAGTQVCAAASGEVYPVYDENSDGNTNVRYQQADTHKRIYALQ